MCMKPLTATIYHLPSTIYHLPSSIYLVDFANCCCCSGPGAAGGTGAPLRGPRPGSPLSSPLSSPLLSSRTRGKICFKIRGKLSPIFFNVFNVFLFLLC